MKRLSWPPKPIVIGTVVALAALCASGWSAKAYSANGSKARSASTSYNVTGDLLAVAAVSATSAWAVGYAGTSRAPKTLIVHWNGQKWSPLTNPKPIEGGLLGLTEVSATDIWAAGFAGSYVGRIVPLVMHWNGTRWSRVPGVPSLNAQFNAVGEAGSTLLAVGATSGPPMLIMNRTGTAWRRFPVPSAAGDLESLVVTGNRGAWAAGVTTTSSGVPNGDVVMRWNGSTWRSVSFPLHGTNENLWHLAAGPGGGVWAVGDSHNNAQTKFTPLSMVWNGTTWRKVAVTAPAGSELSAVTFVPGGKVWAGGSSSDGKHTLIVHWNGKAWSRVATPDRFTGTNYVNAVAATSPSDAWAVGSGTASGPFRTLILHWNGSTWR